LLAATTLGVAASTLHADVQGDARLDDRRTYRLVVQSYSHDAADEHPLASMQREVTAEELRAGVRVGLLEFRQGRWDADSPRANAKPVVLAWIEEGRADLELDGLRARPRPGSLQGTTSGVAEDGALQISVRRA
jgi:hypothetical protein